MHFRLNTTLKTLMWATLIACLLAQAAMAKVYYVSPNGVNDPYPFAGTREAPWASINFADQASILQPGDTVVVMAGTYIHDAVAKGTIKNCSGTADKPITYIAHGKVIIDGQGTTSSAYPAITLGSGIDYIVFDGFEVKGARRCMNITGTAANPAIGNVVRNCTFHDCWGGYMIQNAFIGDCKFYNNLFYISDSVPDASASRAITTASTLYGNKIWNNTIYIRSESADQNKGGIIWNGVSANADPAKMGTDEVRNNIIWPRNGVFGLWCFNATAVYTPEGCEPGTWHGIPFVHTHNFYMPLGLRFQWIFPPVAFADCSLTDQASIGVDVWGIFREWYFDPLFVDAANNDFRLSESSTARNAGVDVGLPFNGPAPDIGVMQPYQPDSIGTLLSKPVGTVFNFAGAVATVASGVFKDNKIYVADELRSGGILVDSLEPLPSISEGDRVIVSGTLANIDGQKVVLGTVSAPIPGTPVKPLGTPGKSLSGNGLDNEGLLVTTWGKVTYKAEDGSYFCVDDGSGKTDGLGNAGVPVYVADLVTPITTLPDPSTNPYVSVTGLVGKKDLGGGLVAVVQPRGATDISDDLN